MSDFIYCEECDCPCNVLPLSCLYKKQGRLKKIHIEDYPEVFNAVNSFVLIGDNEQTQGLLGQKCFDQLCNAVKSAEAAADEYRQNNIDATGEQTEFWFYLDSNWKKMLKNSHFQNMYSSYLMYYYYAFYVASAEASRDGDVKHNRSGVENSGEASNNINDDENKNRTSTHLGIAKRYASMFKNNFLEKNKSLYPCLPKQCSKCSKYHCNTYQYCNTCYNNYNIGEPPHDNKRPPPKKPRSTAL